MKYLFIDIETVPIYGTYSELPKHLKEIWDKKFQNRFKDLEVSYSEVFTSERKYDNNAGFFSLFAKIVCISIKWSHIDMVKSYVGDEKDILTNFTKALNHKKAPKEYKLVGHNIIYFDLPFILQRGIILSIHVAKIIKKIANCKPWEVPAIDTFDLWKLTSREWYSLDYICACLGVKSPKVAMDGSQVAKNFYNGNINGIAIYCEADVVAVENVFNKINNYLLTN